MKLSTENVKKPKDYLGRTINALSLYLSEWILNGNEVLKTRRRRKKASSTRETVR